MDLDRNVQFKKNAPHTRTRLVTQDEKTSEIVRRLCSPCCFNIDPFTEGQERCVAVMTVHTNITIKIFSTQKY